MKEIKDQIKIAGLEVFANHGVFEAENQLGQLFIIDAVLSLDTWAAGITDELQYSVNYAEVCMLIEKKMKEKTFKLIEACADFVAREILRTFPLVAEVSLTIKKPWAPMHMHLDTVSVTVNRGRHQVFLSVGSNMGDSRSIISMALKQLAAIPDIELKQTSDFIVTKAYGYTDQPDFLNGCVELETLMEPEELLQTLHQVEKMFGRERIVHWGPRTLDLDIIFFDDMTINTKDLSVPHIDMANRRFVLEPLNQIAGWYMHPVYKMTVADLYKALIGREKR